MLKKENTEYFNYFSLNPQCSLKFLEDYFVYNKKEDILYKLNNDAFEFLIRNQNISKSIIENTNKEIKDFINFLLAEKILIPTLTPLSQRVFMTDKKSGTTTESLRYLLIHMTQDCNLRCKHCYIGSNNNLSLPFQILKKIFNQFQELHGLIILLSGGEPLCHPNFWEVNNILPNYELRFELLSNGTLIYSSNIAKELNVHHIQISLDGLEDSHDFIRGKGSYKKTIKGIEFLLDNGKDVSISTMISTKNVGEFDAMERLLDSYKISQWIINQPSKAGRWCENSFLSVSIEKAAEIMIRYSRGKGPHKSKTNLVCGSHIATIMANGDMYPCPFLTSEETLLGSIKESGLEELWKNRRGITLSELTECKNCDFIEECRGGCRYRAKEKGNVCGKDPVMCLIYKK